MKMLVIGAGQVGATIVEALHEEHDRHRRRRRPGAPGAISHRFDAGVFAGNGASRQSADRRRHPRRRAIHRLHVARRDQHHRRRCSRAVSSPETKTDRPHGATPSTWRSGASASSTSTSSSPPRRRPRMRSRRASASPRPSRPTSSPSGQVQIVEFDVEPGLPRRPRSMRHAAARGDILPADSSVAAIIRGDRQMRSRAAPSDRPGDRIVVIGSPRRRARVERR